MSQTVKFFKTKLHFAVWFLMLFLSYFIYEDYGIAWDEPEQREIGLTTYNYLNDNGIDLQTYRNRSYGVVIELPLIYIEKALHLNDSSDVFKTRHLVLHLLFLIGVLVFYKLNYLLFGKRVLAFVAMLLLYLTPAVFGHSFINSKDIPLMVFFIFGLYALLLFVVKPTKKKVIFLSAIIGLTMGIRIIGLLMFGIGLLFFIQLFLNKRFQRTVIVYRFLTFVILSLLVFYAVSPAMWLHPISYIKDTFLRMSHFPWNYETLYLGKMVLARDLPWHYLLGWIFLTLPVLHLIFYLAGLYYSYYFAIKNPTKFITSIRMFFVAIAADIPILIVILLIINGSTLYDAWRHVFFLYPFILIISVFGFKRILEHSMKYKYLRILPLPLTYFILLMLALRMTNLHPYQYIFFNHLISHSEENIRNSMEMDYWGISYYEALNNILQSDTSQQIKIKFANFPGEANVLMLDEKDRKRIQVAYENDWKYFVSNFRQHPSDYTNYKMINHFHRLNSTINATYINEKSNY